jgi:hypothetical protein
MDGYNKPVLTLDNNKCNLEPDRFVSGWVDQVDPEKGMLTLGLNVFDMLHTVPITPAMPGWLLRKGTMFLSKIPHSCIQQRNLDSVVWSKFYPQSFEDMSEEDLLDSITGIFYPGLKERSKK